MQAIVVPVNNWLEPNVGDGKQEVCHSTQPLPSHCSLQLHLHDPHSQATGDPLACKPTHAGVWENHW